MKTEYEEHVLTFVMYVKEKETSDVVKGFEKALRSCSNPNKADLHAILEAARECAPNAAARAKRQQSYCDSALRHCNS